MSRFRMCKDGIFRPKFDYRDIRISVSVRLPSKIYDIVMSYDGKNFTDKLINLIFDYKEFYDCNTESDQEM